MTRPSSRHRFMRVEPGGKRAPHDRELAAEVPIALEFNGIGYAVLMATPADIEDLVAGFVISERLQYAGDSAPSVVLHTSNGGIVARANLSADRTGALLERVRHRATDSSCGLCGIESIEQAMRPLPRAQAASAASDAAVFHALCELDNHQPLNRATGAVHAAALVAKDGRIRLVREDVGRHNAFDKLIGAMRRESIDWEGGFALLSSRCSYELVEKAVLAGCPMLATISAPTQLAIDRAEKAGLSLRILARHDALLALS